MVDIVAHELNRSTKYALDTIGGIEEMNLPKNAQSQIASLQAQLKTIRTRLKVLDPIGPSGRNVKTTFNLNELVERTVAYHEAQFKRHNVFCKIIPKGGEWRIKAVEGMFVQIIENLIANSVYWLKFKKISSPTFIPKIEIVIDKSGQNISFTDNGPGVPVSRKEEIFQPFVTTKPPGDGKGLGLYISREIAKYHKSELYMLDDGAARNLNTFILDLNTL